MSEQVGYDGTTADKVDGLDGAKLLEAGRAARRERAEGRTLKARLGAVLADKPAWIRGAAIGGIAFAALVTLLVVVDIALSFGRVHPGVRLADVKVGMATPAGVEARLDEVVGPRLTELVTLHFDDESWQVSGADLGAAIDYEESVERAMSAGREGTLWNRVVTRLRLWYEPYTVPIALSADAALLDTFLEEISAEIDRDPVDAAIVIEGTEAHLESAVLGVAMRTDDVRDALLAQVVSVDRDLTVDVDFLPVEVTDDGAAEALEHTRAMLAGPVEVVYGERSWQFEPESIGEWISFRKVPEGGSSVPTETVSSEATDGAGSYSSESSPNAVDEARYLLQAYVSADEASATLTAAVGEAGSPPVDAKFVVGGGSVTIVPSKDGTGPDIEALAVEMTRVLTGSGERRVELRTQRVEPEITTERAEQMGIKERIATYTTNFSSANRPRVSNIQTLADALDGTLVPPGATFSFNDTIGPRTAEKGYKEAPAIIGGRLVPTLGGGICQVATTIFNTVFESGLPVIERRNHSFYISSYPKGRDAAVSWGGIDFKFKNDTEKWVLIATSYSNSSVTVSLYGTDPGYEVRGVTGEFTDIRPHGVNEIEDDTLAEGMRVIEDSGADGRRIVVRRIISKGGSILREDTFTSTYQPKVETVRVGTKVENGSRVPTATASP